MNFGICNLSIVSLRIEPDDKAEMSSQILFGEYFKVLEIRKKWSRIRLYFDKYEGWIDNKQYQIITQEEYNKLTEKKHYLAAELVDFATDKNNHFYTLTIGSTLPFLKNKKFTVNNQNFSYEGNTYHLKLPKENIISVAYKFLNTPYLWGGKTPFGIDCSGFTQLVYKLCGYALLRDASQQATQGEVLSFIEESEPGDLAFFDDSEGNIIHVGIIMKDNYIIHAHGKVRIDRLDHSGIFNVDTKKHTHKLRVIKKII